MNIEMIKVTIDTIDEIANDFGEIGFLAWQMAYKGIVPDSILINNTAQKRADKLRNIFPARLEEYYLCKADNTSVGYAVIGPPQDDGLPADVGEIHSIYFLPHAWGHGYATQAMTFCLSRLAALGYTTIILWVFEDNRRARRFYEKHGFQFTGQRKELIIDKPVYEICYSLDLSAINSGNS